MYWDNRFRVLVVSLLLILLGAFLVFSSLGAGSDERTQTPLGAHQSVWLSQVKENTAFDRTNLRFLYCIENSHEYFHRFNSSILVNIA
jgi:hypothetical protein